MKYMLTWFVPPHHYEAGISRFLKTGGPPPAGVKLHGRWHSLAGQSGFILAESSDPKAIYAWSAQWADVIKLTVTPVLEDADASGVLQGLRKK